jgi:hypothetical protein
MNGFWQSMAAWQRLAVGAGAIALVLGGILAWGSFAGGRATDAAMAGSTPQGAVCPAEPPTGQAVSGDVALETADAAGTKEAWTPSDKTELATFALG